MSLFSDVKAAVILPEVARYYGYSPNRAGYISCPFHSEKTPSMKLYDRSFYCYGCGAHGSAVDFVKDLFNLSPLEAARKIDADFGLYLADDPPDREELDKRHLIQDIRKLYEAWRENMLNQFDTVIRIANLADYEDLSDAEVAAIRYREAFESWSDILLHGTISQQMEVFRDREGVERLCRMILSSTPKRLNTA